MDDYTTNVAKLEGRLSALGAAVANAGDDAMAAVTCARSATLRLRQVQREIEELYLAMGEIGQDDT